MELEKIRQLMELAAASPFGEFIYQEGDSGLTLRREDMSARSQPVSDENISPAGLSHEASQTPSQNGAAVSLSAQTGVLPAEDVITSPLVGVFYAAAGEGEAPFVALGSRVKKGQVIGIIETMKLMNELEAEEDGEITGILVENEQVVEYGQPLFRIRPMR